MTTRPLLLAAALSLAACATPPPPQAPPASEPAPLPPPPPTPPPPTLGLAPVVIEPFASVQLAPPHDVLMLDRQAVLKALPRAVEKKVHAYFTSTPYKVDVRTTTSVATRTDGKTEKIEQKHATARVDTQAAAKARDEAIAALEAADKQARGKDGAVALALGWAQAKKSPAAGRDALARASGLLADKALKWQAQHLSLMAELLSTRSTPDSASKASERIETLLADAPADHRLHLLLWQAELAQISGDTARLERSLAQVSQAESPRSVEALHGLARLAKRKGEMGKALGYDIQALAALESHKNAAGSPWILPPELGRSAADSLLRAERPEGASLLSSLAADTPAAAAAPILAAAALNAVARHDVPTAIEASRLLLARAPASLEAAIATRILERDAVRRGDAGAAVPLQKQLASQFASTSPWAEALRGQRGLNGYPDDATLAGAPQAIDRVPSPIASLDNPPTLLDPRARNLVEHCASEVPAGTAPFEVSFLIEASADKPEHPSVAQIQGAHAALGACLSRDAAAFLRWLPPGPWRVLIKARVAHAPG